MLALGNIAADTPEARDFLLEQGCREPLLRYALLRGFVPLQAMCSCSAACLKRRGRQAAFAMPRGHCPTCAVVAGLRLTLQLCDDVVCLRISAQISSQVSNALPYLARLLYSEVQVVVAGLIE